MKIKILKNVVAGRSVAKAGAVLEMDRKTAAPLLEGGFAEEHRETAPQQQQQQQPPITRETLLKQYTGRSPAELDREKAGIEKFLANKPDSADAKLALEVVTELLKGKTS